MSRRYTVRSVSVRFERRRARARLRVVFVSPHAPVGPTMVDTHSYKLSPFGPALQFVGGSSEISANSFWMRLALLDSELFFSLIRPSLSSSRSFLRSFVRWRPSRSPRVARLVSSRLGRRLDSVVVSARRTLTSRRRRRGDDSLKSSSHHHRLRKKTKQKHSPSSNGRARGGGCKPYLRCVYQTDMIICGVILYDPNVRDYICVHIERFRLERFRCRSASDEASSDDAIDRTNDSSIDGGTVFLG